MVRSVIVRRVLDALPLPAFAPGEPLPKEFCIFHAGINASSKGPCLFDAEAAKLVMDRFALEGVDCMIDLQHESFADLPLRSDMNDARGWFKLEVRNGELWAVDVSWTPDGERRLRERTQRYMSPAFDMDEATGRVVGLWNVALVAMPATYGAAPLVASRETRGSVFQTEEEFMRELSAAVGLAHYPWDQCISDQLAAGHSQDSAANICGSIKAQNQGKLLAKLAEVLNAKPSAPMAAALERATGAPLARVFAAASLRFVARSTRDLKAKTKAYTLLRQAKAKR